MLVSLAIGKLSNRPETGIETESGTAAPATFANVQTDPDRAMIERQEKDRRAREFLLNSLLSDAQEATADYRLTTPVATSAFTYYQKILDLDPEHAEAIKGIDNIADIWFCIITGHIFDGSREESDARIAILDDYQAGYDRDNSPHKDWLEANLRGSQKNF